MSVDQIPDTFDDPELEQAFRQLEAESHTLDPAQVMVRGRRRRLRQRVFATGSAVLAAAAVSTVALVASSLEPGEPPVAQQSAPAPAPRTIPDGKWVKVSQTQWFKFSNGVGRSSNQPSDLLIDDVRNYPPEQRKQVLEHQRRVKETVEQTRKQGWDGPNLSSLGTRVWDEIYLRGDVRRVVFSVSGKYGEFQYEAKLFRLGGLPGWVYAIAEFPAPSPVSSQGLVEVMTVKLDAYDADGRRILRCGYNPRPTSKADASTALPVCDQG